MSLDHIPNLPIRPTISRSQLEILRIALSSLPNLQDNLQQFDRIQLQINLDQAAARFDVKYGRLRTQIKLSSTGAIETESSTQNKIAEPEISTRNVEQFKQVLLHKIMEEELGFDSLKEEEQDLIVSDLIKDIPPVDWTPAMGESFNRVMSAKILGKSDVKKELKEAAANVVSPENL